MLAQNCYKVDFYQLSIDHMQKAKTCVNFFVLEIEFARDTHFSNCSYTWKILKALRLYVSLLKKN
jgi:hypothetical protein